MIAPRKELSLLVPAYLARLGFCWDTVKTALDMSFSWRRPPFYTELVLAGQPLGEHIAVPYSGGLDRLTDVYERFIAGYLRHKTFHAKDPAKWLQRELGMSVSAARQMFVSPEPGRLRRGLHLILVQFAALVSYNYACQLEETEDTFVVTTEEGWRFGVYRGRLVSNLKRVTRVIPVQHLWSGSNSLADIARGGPAESLAPTPFDAARWWLENNAKQVGRDLEPLMMGLRIMWWRSGGRVSSRMKAVVVRERSEDVLREAVAEARNFRNFRDPVQALHDIFVPQFLSYARFSKTFGKATLPLSPRVIERWDRMLNDLDPVHQEK